MTYLGQMTYFLGMEFLQVANQIFVHQTTYAKDLLKKFNMSLCKIVPTPLVSGVSFNKIDDSNPLMVNFTEV